MDRHGLEYAQDISGDGRIIVGNNASFGAFIQDAAHGVRQLDLTLMQAYGLADTLRGWILNRPLDEDRGEPVAVGIAVVGEQARNGRRIR